MTDDAKALLRAPDTFEQRMFALEQLLADLEIAFHPFRSALNPTLRDAHRLLHEMHALYLGADDRHRVALDLLFAKARGEF